MNTKAITSFTHYRNAEFGPVAHTVHDLMTLNAATFTTPPVTMAALLLQCNDYDAKMIAKASGAKADTLACKVARNVLQVSLRELGNYVNDRAQGNPTIVMESGFPSYTTSRLPNDTPPPAPTDVRMSQGPVTGSCIVRFKPSRNASVNDVETNTVDPMLENEWKNRVSFKGGRVELTGFTKGTQVWVRLRTQGVKLIVGDWCSPATMFVV